MDWGRCVMEFRSTPWARLLLGAGAIAWGGAAAAVEPADVLIQGGMVYAGADAPPLSCDVVIGGDQILYVGAGGGTRYRAREIVNARGKIVAPGFIDAHAHPDTYIRSSDPEQRLNAPWLFQGVTTLLIGVDGDGTPDVANERTTLEREGIGTNLVPYVGFGAIRKRVLHDDARAPNAAEVERMRALVDKGMCEGAIGFSTGLFYPPQSFATTEEVIALAKEAARRYLRYASAR